MGLALVALHYNELSEDDNSYDNASYDSISDPRLKTTFLTHNSTGISGLHLQTSYFAGAGGKLSLAADTREERWNDDGLLHDVPVSGTTGGGGGGGKGGGGGGKGGGGGGKGGGAGGSATTYTTQSIAEQRRIGVRSVALEYSVSPLAHTGLTAGLSHAWQVRDEGRRDDADGYLLGGYYDVSAATRLRASLSRHVRFPTIRQLYDPTSGNLALDPESARNAEIGAKHRLSAATSVGAVAFRDDVHNYIEQDRVTNQFMNYDRYVFRGVELTLHTRATRRLSLDLAYTHLLAQNLSAGADSVDLQYRPRDKASADAAYDFGGGLTGYGSVILVGDQAYFSRTTPAAEAQLPGYALLDFKLEKRIPGTHSALFLGADNLFDKEYETSYGFPQAGRFIYAGVDYEL